MTSDRTLIHLDHLTFSDSNVSGWAFRELTNWWGATQNKVPGVERPSGVGAFQRRRATRRSRVISFQARYRGSSAAEVERAYDELAAIGADMPARMGVTTDDGTSWRTVIVEQQDAQSTHNRRYGWVDVDVTADDPRRYGDAEWLTTDPPSAGVGLVWPVVWPAVWPGGGSPGRVTLVNDGRAPSPSSFVLRGGFDTAVVTCVETGDRVGFARPLPEGSVVTFDAETRRALLNGQDASRWLRYRQWTDVPGLSSRTFQFDVTGATGSPSMSGRVLPAWW
ncbi:hypothetical protein SK224_16470 [Microbacterium sp. BG28]|uniref:hypothetical protein n=1 Tax=Microbacterium sp. BG28 TaxID=3097356 RepID=UPI002A59EAF5|nr:hypothetical protein [Microbacterium sp. BG28]MDY0830731.1 hypothetical protein [Microbacterium sp. BG28]